MIHATPQLSVLLPVYNSERYISQAINSIRQQSWTDFEFILIDDASTDSTPSILLEAAACDERIVLLRHDQSLGLATAFNTGLEQARSEYIAQHHADDWSFPERFAKQIQFLDEHPQILALGTGAVFRDGQAPRKVYTHPAVVGWRMLFSNQLVHGSVMFRRAIAQTKGDSAQFPHAEDYELWTRLRDTQALDNLAERLITKRNGNGISAQAAALQRTSTMQIMQRSISSLLGQTLDWAEIEALYQAEHNQAISDPAMVWRVAQRYQTLFHVYCQRTNLAATEVREIKADIGQRFSKLARRNAQLPRWLQSYLIGSALYHKVQTASAQSLWRKGMQRVRRIGSTTTHNKPTQQARSNYLPNFQDVGNQQVVLVAGSGRSGTTWLQEIINYRNDYRVLFEPFWHQHLALWPAELALRPYIRANSHQPTLAPIARQILDGEIKFEWADRYNGPGIYQRRLIKEIRANLMLQWLCRVQPQLKLIFIMRHPCAVAASQLSTGWPTGRQRILGILPQAELMQDFLNPFAHLFKRSYDPFMQRILLWALDNYVPLHQFTPHQMHLIFYEELCTEPEPILKRLYTFLDLPMPVNLSAVLARPSPLSVSNSAILNGTSLVNSWRKRVDATQVRQAIELLNHFGLDKIYQESPLPNRSAAEQQLRQNAMKFSIKKEEGN